MTIHLNGQPVAAAAGETVLNVLNAVGLRRLARNDHGQASGAFCGMGVCHCCLVAIDGRPKRRACQTVVRSARFPTAAQLPSALYSWLRIVSRRLV